MPRHTYKDSWDLTTIPEAPFKSEVARRTRALGPRATYQNLQPCSKCGTQLNTVQRRKPCPECGWRNIKRSNTGQFIPNPHTPDQWESTTLEQHPIHPAPRLAACPDRPDQPDGISPLHRHISFPEPLT